MKTRRISRRIALLQDWKGEADDWWKYVLYHCLTTVAKAVLHTDLPSNSYLTIEFLGHPFVLDVASKAELFDQLSCKFEVPSLPVVSA